MTVDRLVADGHDLNTSARRDGPERIKIEAAKSAALEAVEQASWKRDVEVAVLAFEGDCSQPVSRHAGFTTDFTALAAFINSLQAGGGTPMAEAVLFANRFMKNQGAASARDQMIVLLADGQNDCGDVNDALNQLRASGIILRHETVGFGIQPNSPAARDLQLQDIATASGGGYHHARDATQLGDLFMEFVNTFTVIDMQGMFGRGGRASSASGRLATRQRLPSCQRERWCPEGPSTLSSPRPTRSGRTGSVMGRSRLPVPKGKGGNPRPKRHPTTHKLDRLTTLGE